MRKLGFISAGLMAVSMGASAQDEPIYWGVMAGGSNYQEPGYTFDMTTFTGRLIYNINDLISVEGRVASSDKGMNKGASFTLDFLGSALVKLNYHPLKDSRLAVYGLAGLTGTRTTVEVSTLTSVATDTGYSLGVGVDLFADDDSGITLEWVRYMDSKQRGVKYTLDHAGLGYVQRF